MLKANRLEQILKRLNPFQLIKEPTRVSTRYKTLIDVIITNNRDTVIHAETSISIADHHDVSCTINLRKQRMKPFQIYVGTYANYSAENFQIKLMQLSNQLNLMYTERNKWYILTYLSESGYCLQINPNYQVN